VEIKENYSLQHLNTFGIKAYAKLFVEVNAISDILELITSGFLKNHLWMVLGGGSNILFTKDFDGLVIKNSLFGIEIEQEDSNTVLVRAMAGELWDNLVSFAIKHNLGGIENLSLIPGSVGAAPVQNIGAYGVELKDTFESLEAINTKTGEIEVFSNDACKFGYRDSIFKNELKGLYIIVSISLRLQKNPIYNVEYFALKEKLKDNSKPLSVSLISEYVSDIRRSKLPDPKVIGNAGSFFKNPEITLEKFTDLKSRFPDIQSFDLPNGDKKIPAGWLIEQVGLKGKQFGQTGSHKNQALVLVNYGEAKGEEILALANLIKKSVLEKFDIELKEEVTTI